MRSFMNAAEIRSVLTPNRLLGGEIWTLPIMLQVSRMEAETLRLGEFVQLKDSLELPIHTTARAG